MPSSTTGASDSPQARIATPCRMNGIRSRRCDASSGSMPARVIRCSSIASTAPFSRTAASKCGSRSGKLPSSSASMRPVTKTVVAPADLHSSSAAMAFASSVLPCAMVPSRSTATACTNPAIALRRLPGALLPSTSLRR